MLFATIIAYNFTAALHYRRAAFFGHRAADRLICSVTLLLQDRNVLTPVGSKRSADISVRHYLYQEPISRIGEG